MRKLYAPCIRLTLAQHRNGSVARAVGQHPSEASPRSGCAIPAQKAVEEEDGTAKISEECDRGPEYSTPESGRRSELLARSADWADFLDNDFATTLCE